MVFPLKIFSNTGEKTLVILKEEGVTHVSSSEFLTRLKYSLERIAIAAKDKFSVECSVESFTDYLASSQEEEIRFQWKEYSKSGFSMKSALPVMVKLVNYLKEYGARNFPDLFGSKSSLGRQLVERSLETLYRLVQKQTFEEAFISTLAPIPLPIESPKKISDSIATKVAASQKESIPFSSTEKAPGSPLFLTSSTIELFGSQSYEGIDSEEEEDQERKEKTEKTVRSEIVEGISPYPLTIQPIKRSAQSPLKMASKKRRKITIIVEAPFSSSTVVRSREDLEAASSLLALSEITKEVPLRPINKPRLLSLKDCLVLPCFVINKKFYRDNHIKVIMGYRAKSTRYGLNQIRIYCRHMLLQNRDSIFQILDPQNSSTILWQDGSARHIMIDREVALRRSLQGMQANLEYLQANYPELLIGRYPYTPLKDLQMSIEALKAALNHNPSFSDLLEQNVSEKTQMIPRELFKQIEARKYEELAVLLSQKEITAPLTMLPHCFTYLFAIYKLTRTSKDYDFKLHYVELKTIGHVSSLKNSYRYSLKNTLKNIGPLLETSLNRIVFENPTEDTSQSFKSQQELLKTLLEGLRENYLYITHCTPAIFSNSKYVILKKDLLETIEDLKTLCSIETEEEFDLSKSIIGRLVQQAETESFVSLSNILIKNFPAPSFIEPYLFSVNRAPGTMIAHYNLAYRKMVYKGESNFYKKCRRSFNNTLQVIKEMITIPSMKAVYSRPLDNRVQEMHNAPNVLWPIILQGLTEMKLYYPTHFPELIQNDNDYALTDELQSVIELILKEKAQFCSPLRTDMNIMAALMAASKNSLIF